MAGIETAVEAARRYIIKRPRLTRLLDNANSRVLMLIGPAGFGKTTLAREWAAERTHVWYQGTTATADVAALAAGLSDVVSELIPEAGSRMVHRMRATGTPEEDVDVLAEFFAEDLADWPEDAWLVFDDYQFAMDAEAPERFVEVLLRDAPVRMLLTSRKRPSWASARLLLYGQVYELGRTDLAMDHEEASSVLAHRKDAPAPGLVALAEGWPAVIGLAALMDEIELPEGSLPEALYEYFAEELFRAASPEAQRGLCKLALAPSLSHGVPDLVLGERAEAILAESFRLGFLTSSRPGSIDLHPLVRTFLDSRNSDDDANGPLAEKLARHLATRERWDDAFILVGRFFSKHVFEELLEGALPELLREARYPTLTFWLKLARGRKVDAAVVDYAEAEVAFRRALWQQAESFAIRAARRFPSSHTLVSRAFYTAGSSAHMDYRNQEALTFFTSARETALDQANRRDAIWGQIMSSVDLDRPNVPALMAELLAHDDGSAMSQLRAISADVLIGIRTGQMQGLLRRVETAQHLVGRVEDPLAVSSFMTSLAFLLAIAARYQEALDVALRAETYAKSERLLFVLPHTKRMKAMATWGLRHFSRARTLIDSVERDGARLGNAFLHWEGRFLRCRLLLAQQLFDRAIEVLGSAPHSFPFEGERAECLGMLALGEACLGKADCALELADQAEQTGRTIEALVLVPCARAIVSTLGGRDDAASLSTSAFRTALDMTSLDPFVVAYRACPAILRHVAAEPRLREELRDLMAHAQDTKLASIHGLEVDRPGGKLLSHREREVLGMIAQGLTNKEIAQALFITESTAKVHVRHILDKLGVRTRTEAALRAAETGDG